MVGSELDLQKKLQRRSLTARKRQSIFVAQYVHTKYKHIYREAAQMFNQLNVLHPHQPNLTKSIEFRNWQRRINGLPPTSYFRKREAANNITYENIPEQTIDSCQDVRNHDDSEQSNDAIIQSCTSCQDVRNNDDSEQSNDAIIQSGTKKVMCLEIPLIDVSQIQPQDGTETDSHHQSEVHQEIVAEGEANRDNLAHIEPSILDNIPQETMDELISQLQDDPALTDIMNSFDVVMNVEVGNSTPKEQPEQDEFDLDIDLDIDDRLERELADILQ